MDTRPGFAAPLRAAPDLPRRRLLAGVAAGAAVLAAGTAARAACALTPRQPEGPFYPVAIGEADWDLTLVSGATGRAEGTVIEVTGRVFGAGCRPLPGCVIELWQANRHGRYDHPGDRQRERPLDPNFQGYARLAADVDGAYRLVTIVPGAYPASPVWMRPPHIHFRLQAPGHRILTTQMYFAGDPLNERDRLLASVPPDRRAALQVAFDRRTADGIQSGTFDMTLAGS
jgi:protocatechuate 3,4-dioxygenase beta subunit